MSTTTPPLDPVALQNSVIETARRFQVIVDEQKVKDCLKIFNSFFFSSNNYIQFRVAKKKNIHQFNWRSEYFEMDMNSTQILDKILELRKNSPTVEDKINTNSIIYELGKAFPTAGLGIDFEPSKGMVKLWHFGRYRVNDLLKLESLPKQTLSEIIPKISEYGLSRVYCTGVDYEKQSMNFYFLWGEGGKMTENHVRGILKSLGFPFPEDNVIEGCVHASCFAVTINCASDKVDRVCFYIPFLWQHVEYFEKEPFATHIKEHTLPTVVEDSASDSFVGCSIGKDNQGNLDFYMKLESDYHNSYFYFLSQIMEFHSKK